jgi:Flp pilus assembly protein TadG
MVEFALILPMMLVVMFMITEFGRALYQYNALTTAVREAARQGVVSGSGSAIAVATARADSVLVMGRINPSDVTLTVDILNNYGGVQGVKVLRVRAVKPFNWALKGPLNVNAGAGSATVNKSTLNLTAESIMHTEAF